MTEKEKAAVGQPIFRLARPHGRGVLRRGSDHRPENGALLHLLSALQIEQSVTASSWKGCTPESLILGST